MLKSRLIIFNEFNLLKDIEHFRNTTGNEVSELQCNHSTFYIWGALYRDVLNYPVEYNTDDKSKGIVGRFQGIPIVINKSLEDGIIGIK